MKLDGGDGPDVISGGPSAEQIFSGGATTRNAGSSWVDVLDGGGGDDVVASIHEHINPQAADQLSGGPGADQMVAASVCSFSSMSGGSGGPDIAGFAQMYEDIRAVAGGTVSQVRPFGLRCPPARLADDLEIMEGGFGDDILIGSQGRDALILGKEGDDKLIGRGGADRLRGEEGSDVLLGGSGPDVLEARDGEKDSRISCGAEGKRATSDGGKDPKPQNC